MINSMVLLELAPQNPLQADLPGELAFGILLAWLLLMTGFCLFLWMWMRKYTRLERRYEALRLSHTRLEQYLEALPFGAAVVGPDLRLAWMNRGFSGLFGLGENRVEPPGSLDGLLQIRPVYRAGTTERYPLELFPAALALSGQAAWAEDVELECSEGRIPLEVRAEPLLDNSKQVVAALFVCQEIGARRQHEQGLARQIQELELLVGLRLEELRYEHEDRLKVESALHKLVTTDPQTGLLNFRHWSSLADRYIKQAARYQHPLSLVLIDIDHFQNVNDIYGHQVGDEALIRIATTLRDNLRNVDLLARLEGDRFIVLLPDTRQSGAEVLAERLRARVASLMLESPKGKVAVTLSIGLTELCPGESLSLEQFIDQAELALYGAKHSGRNRVMAYEPMQVS